MPRGRALRGRLHVGLVCLAALTGCAACRPSVRTPQIPVATAQPAHRLKVVKVSGRATIGHGGSTVPVAADGKIVTSATIRTDATATMILAGTDGMLLQLGPDTELVVDKLGDTHAAAGLTLLRGEVLGVMPEVPMAREPLGIQLAHGLLRVHSGIFRTVYRPSGTGQMWLQASCVSGTVELGSDGQAPAAIPAGTALEAMTAFGRTPGGQSLVGAAPASTKPAPLNAAVAARMRLIAAELAAAAQGTGPAREPR